MRLAFSFTVALLTLQGASAFAAPSSSSNNSGLSKLLSVTELKRLLSERGVDFRDCIEKRDLVERLEQSNYFSSSSRKPLQPLEPFTQEETRLMQTFKRVAPSVAFITTTVSRSPQMFSLQNDRVPAGTGSGFLWDDQGHVVTNAHVVMAAGRTIPSTVKVKLQGLPNSYDATVVGVEPEKDLAVLKIPVAAATATNKLPRPLDVGTSNDLQVGQRVLAIGNPFGLDNTLTTGVVSALGRDIQGFGGRKIRGCVQTDAAINAGNSGGPLLDSRGRLIGVNTAIYSSGPGGGNVGIGFAIPSDTVRRVVNQIIRYGRVVRPTLGIQVTEDRVVRSIEAQLGRTLNGVLVAEVWPNSPAEQAGLQASALYGDGSMRLGDLITAVDDQTVTQVEDLLSAIEEKNEGDTVRLRIRRGCSERRSEIVTAKLVSRDKMKGGNNNNISNSNYTDRNGSYGRPNARRGSQFREANNVFQ